jgi:hypothetical protein
MSCNGGDDTEKNNEQSEEIHFVWRFKRKVFASYHTMSDDVSRRSTRFVELYHCFCLANGRKPLLTPDLSIGGKVTDAGTHFVCWSKSDLGGKIQARRIPEKKGIVP